MHERPGTVLLANPTEVKQIRAGTRLRGRGTSEIQRRGQTGSEPETAQHHVVGLETHRSALRDSETGRVKRKRKSGWGDSGTWLAARREGYTTQGRLCGLGALRAFPGLSGSDPCRARLGVISVLGVSGQFSRSVVSDSLRPMDCSTPGLPVHHQLPEFTQTPVRPVGDAIQPSHPLSSPSPPAFSLPQHQGFHGISYPVLYTFTLMIHFVIVWLQHFSNVVWSETHAARAPWTNLAWCPLVSVWPGHSTCCACSCWCRGDAPTDPVERIEGVSPPGSRPGPAMSQAGGKVDTEASRLGAGGRVL